MNRDYVLASRKQDGGMLLVRIRLPERSAIKIDGRSTGAESDDCSSRVVVRELNRFTFNKDAAEIAVEVEYLYRRIGDAGRNSVFA
jgi:hypothetical protein